MKKELITSNKKHVYLTVLFASIFSLFYKVSSAQLESSGNTSIKNNGLGINTDISILETETGETKDEIQAQIEELDNCIKLLKNENKFKNDLIIKAKKTKDHFNYLSPAQDSLKIKSPIKKEQLDSILRYFEKVAWLNSAGEYAFIEFKPVYYNTESLTEEETIENQIVDDIIKKYEELWKLNGVLQSYYFLLNNSYIEYNKAISTNDSIIQNPAKINITVKKLLDWANANNNSDNTSKIKDYIDNLIDGLEYDKTQIDNYLGSAKSTKIKFNRAKKNADKSTEEKAIQLGLPLFCFTVIALFAGAFFYRKYTVTLLKSNKETSSEEIANGTAQVSRMTLDVITVLLITLSVLILGLSGILQEEVLGTLLGGIAAYVLNRNANGDLLGFNQSKGTVSGGQQFSSANAAGIQNNSPNLENTQGPISNSINNITEFPTPTPVTKQ